MKYVKPKSLTWWTSLVPLLCGLLLATADLHGMPQVTSAIHALFGPDATPAVLINAGLAVLGLRAAVEPSA